MRRLHAHGPDLLWTCAISPDGRTALTGQGQPLVWNLTQTGDPPPLRGHTNVVRAIDIAGTFLLLNTFLSRSGGKVLVVPIRKQIRPGKYREPDILLVLRADDIRRQDAFWLGADLVVEVVSPDDPDRDLVEKVADYAEAGIPEYWIVNPIDETISVLTLTGAAYTPHGIFPRGTHAASHLLTGFSVHVDDVFDARSLQIYAGG